MTTAYYLATCQDCSPVLPMPFTDPGKRDEWAEAHLMATGHTVTRENEIRGGGGGTGAPLPFCGVPGHPGSAHGGHPQSSVPVPVLEALASAWEDQADTIKADSAPNFIAGQTVALSRCARMLREAIAHGGQG